MRLPSCKYWAMDLAIVSKKNQEYCGFYFNRNNAVKYWEMNNKAQEQEAIVADARPRAVWSWYYSRADAGMKPIMKPDRLPWAVYCSCWNPPCVLRWLSLQWPALHEWSLTFLMHSCWSQIRTMNRRNVQIKNTCKACKGWLCHKDILSQNYLDKRTQVVLQALLMTSRDYMYDHTEKHGMRQS